MDTPAPVQTEFDFLRWKSFARANMDALANEILTNHNAKTMDPDLFLYELIAQGRKPLKVLDFGCGIGRNSFGMKRHYPHWGVTGYDSAEMLARTTEYYRERYGDDKQPRVDFCSDWRALRTCKFDVIICVLVLQHIKETDLQVYLSDFKNMTNRLVVCGRRDNDDDHKNTWRILELAGLQPHSCTRPGGYVWFGDPEEHFTCTYSL